MNYKSFRLAHKKSFHKEMIRLLNKINKHTGWFDKE